MAVTLNQWFDRVPQSAIVLGTRRVSLFQVWGIVGFQTALLLQLLGGFRAGITPFISIGAGSAAALSFFAFARLRRFATGAENLVLFEHVWVALATLAGFYWLADVPVAQGLDVSVAAIAVFLAGGRVGCFSSGCCHGHTTTVGMRYDERSDLAPRLLAHRLFPVQLVEAIGLLVIAAISFVLVSNTPGVATVWFLIAYAVLRFSDELLRGDRRPSISEVPVATWSSLVQLVAGIALGQYWIEPSPDAVTTTIAAVLLTMGIAGALLLMRRRAAALESFEHLNETWDVVARLADEAGTDPVVAETSERVVAAASREGDAVHVSLSHPVHATDGLGRAIHIGAWSRNGLTHLVMPARGVPSAARSDAPVPEPQSPDAKPAIANVYRPAADYFEQRRSTA